MKRLLVSVATVALMLLTAAPVGATHNQPQREVPIVGSEVGADSFGPPTDCPAGAAWLYSSIGTGNISHLGRVTTDVTHCSFLNPDGTGSFGPGTETYTAPNGDVLNVTHQGTFYVSSDGPFSYLTFTWQVTGGTGRFAHATGGGEGAGVSDLVAGTTSVTFWGSIAYDASDSSSH